MPRLRRAMQSQVPTRAEQRLVLASSCAGWIEGRSRRERMVQRHAGRRCDAWQRGDAIGRQV